MYFSSINYFHCKIKMQNSSSATFFFFKSLHYQRIQYFGFSKRKLVNEKSSTVSICSKKTSKLEEIKRSSRMVSYGAYILPLDSKKNQLMKHWSYINNRLIFMEDKNLFEQNLTKMNKPISTRVFFHFPKIHFADFRFFHH